MSSADRPIDRYLDALFDELRAADPATARRLIAEVEGHLLESAADLEGSGLGRIEAERTAVDRFGPPARIAAETRRAVRARPVEFVLAAFRPAVFLAGVGLAAVGVSGAVAATMSAMFGRDFVGSLRQTYGLAFAVPLVRRLLDATRSGHFIGT